MALLLHYACYLGGAAAVLTTLAVIAVFTALAIKLKFVLGVRITELLSHVRVVRLQALKETSGSTVRALRKPGVFPRTASSMADLPDDLLAAIFGRLTVRSLATSRGVCRAWRAIVDERRLLSPVPAPPSPLGPRIDGAFRFIEYESDYTRWTKVLDHCNGLVLYWDDDARSFYVVIPLTRRWKRLPRLDDDDCNRRWKKHAFLVFNPIWSRHYKVLLGPRKPQMAGEKLDDDAWRLTEWPPSRWTWHEFSSKTGRWRKRVLVREGEAAGKVADFIMEDLPYSVEPRWRFAAYWKGDLYVHCQGEFIARMFLSKSKYQVIKSPIDGSESYNRETTSFLGRSEKGV